MTAGHRRQVGKGQKEQVHVVDQIGDKSRMGGVFLIVSIYKRCKARIRVQSSIFQDLRDAGFGLFDPFRLLRQNAVQQEEQRSGRGHFGAMEQRVNTKSKAIDVCLSRGNDGWVFYE